MQGYRPLNIIIVGRPFDVLTVHLALVGQNDLSPSARGVDGQSLLEALLYVGTPHAFCVIAEVISNALVVSADTAALALHFAGYGGTTLGTGVHCSPKGRHSVVIKWTEVDSKNAANDSGVLKNYENIFLRQKLT